MVSKMRRIARNTRQVSQSLMLRGTTNVRTAETSVPTMMARPSKNASACAAIARNMERIFSAWRSDHDAAMDHIKLANNTVRRSSSGGTSEGAQPLRLALVAAQAVIECAQQDAQLAPLVRSQRREQAGDQRLMFGKDLLHQARSHQR